MAETNIEWTERTWNPVVGCSVLSPGCTNCYAMRMAARLEAISRAHEARHPNEAAPLAHYRGLTRPSKAGPVWTGAIRLAPDSILAEPLKRKKPTTYFVNSMSDLFHEDLPDEDIDKIVVVMVLTPEHTYQVLTKRTARMRKYLNDPSLGMRIGAILMERARGDAATEAYVIGLVHKLTVQGKPLPNVWFGTSTEDQTRADERLPELMATRAAVRFISAEPLIGGIDIAWALSPNRLDIAAGFLKRGHFSPGLETLRPLDWVIVGGESGPHARPMHPDWARSLRDQCKAAGVAFFFKQHGDWREAFHEEDGATIDEVEADSAEAEAIADVVSTRTRAFIRADGQVFRGHPHNLPDGRWRLVEKIGKGAAGRVLDGLIHDSRPQVAA